MLDIPGTHYGVNPTGARLVDKFAIAGTVAECRVQVERIKKSGIQQIAIIPYSAPGETRADTLRGFAKAVS
jgi:hypothetical protein